MSVLPIEATIIDTISYYDVGAGIVIGLGSNALYDLLKRIGKTIAARCVVNPRESIYPSDALIECVPKVIMQRQQIGDNYFETLWTAHLMNARKGTIKWTRNGHNWEQT